jgi:aminoglycoside 6-adenylyltransferase
MMNWYIGINHGFELSTGKDGKYFKHYLPPELYNEYAATYSGSDYKDIWEAVYAMCDLFNKLAIPVAKAFDFTYCQEEEDGIRTYMKMMETDRY